MCELLINYKNSLFDYKDYKDLIIKETKIKKKELSLY